VQTCALPLCRLTERQSGSGVAHGPRARGGGRLMGADAFFRRMALADVEGVWRPLLTGLACAIAGIALRFALTGLFTNAPGLSVLYPFVVLAALWGGWRSGAVALAAGLAGVWAATAMPGAADVFPLALGLYLIVG